MGSRLGLQVRSLLWGSARDWLADPARATPSPCGEKTRGPYRTWESTGLRPGPASSTSRVRQAAAGFRFALAGAVLLGFCASALADRNIDLPTARKVLRNTYKVGALWNPQSPRSANGYLRAPVLDAGEIEFQAVQRPGRQNKYGFSAAYQFAVPLVDTAPGLMAGIEDVSNATSEGRSAYAVLTYRIGLDGDYLGEIPAELSVGFGSGRFRGVFLGFMLPVTPQWRIVAENDFRASQAGIEFRPHRDVQLQWIFREQQGSRLGAFYTVRL